MREDHGTTVPASGSKADGPTALQGGTGALPPAMPESPIPDWSARNRTPDPLTQHSSDATAVQSRPAVNDAQKGQDRASGSAPAVTEFATI
ncbi:hypothetical protein [uncultured Paracoccus sp.]|uniref:hypothetical protein n=1 Tax=uncultured Paracoccus sp. TaxID=189685 RepID=UPI00259A2318|nr:hypothetical protein [uncultured Paracoccus sp.]